MTIQLLDVSKQYPVRDGRRTILDQINLQINSGVKVGILGKNGAGKSTLIRLIGGVEAPSSGKIIRNMSVSWPIAFSGGFQGSLTGIDNVKFIARLYGIDYRQAIDYVQEFSELGIYMREPVKTYSSGMRAKLAFGISLAVEFDCYLIDEVVAVGDARFKQKCNVELFEKRQDRAMLFVSHDAKFIKKHCDIAHVIHDGKLFSFDTVQLAYDFYSDIEHVNLDSL